MLAAARRGLFLTRVVLRATPALATAAPALIGARRTLCNSLFELSDDIDVDSVSYGFMASQAIFCALEVGVYEAIAGAGEGGLTADALKTACSINAPRLQTLLTSLTAIKSLKRNAATGAYTLSPNSARYLVQSSRQYYGDYLRYQMGRQFYHRMGALPDVMTTGEAPSYASWFSDPATAAMYTQAQHNGSVATAKYLVKKKLQLGSVTSMLDVGGGSGAFSYVFVESTPGLKSTVLELPEVCKTGNGIKAKQSPDVQARVAFTELPGRGTACMRSPRRLHSPQARVAFTELDATKPDWPVKEADYELVLMSYISGSVPEAIIGKLYENAFKALKPGGRLLVHDFMVNDSLDGPALGSLWALQHVTVNAGGLGLTPAEVISRMTAAGFAKCETMEMINGLTKLIVAYKK